MAPNMPQQQPFSYYAAQGAMTDPGAHGALFDALPRDLAALCRVIQGLLIHDDQGRHLYGAPPADFHLASRETLPVARRLDAVLASRGEAITSAGPPFARSVGTCRDFALMLCAMLRQQGVPARVRCGFARYFQPPSYEDHWVCEYWRADRHAWALADAQLDEAHLTQLSIGFDPADIPEDQFVFAWQAWRLCRSKAADPALFGHGADTGAWFVRVNLARDLLALGKRETSAWDTWRDARAEHRALDPESLSQCDRLAALAETAEGSAQPELEDARTQEFLSRPPWRG